MIGRSKGEGETIKERDRTHRSIVLAVAGLVYLTCAVFWPIVSFEFVGYDVREQLLERSWVQDLSVENLGYIFTSRCITSYYPVRTLTFAVDNQLWGLNPGGFKLTNGLIHLANVLMVFWLVLRLFRHPIWTDGSWLRWWDVCVATFAAGAFAVHPVVVEPVTWVAGREELLMTLGTLGCIHFQLTARRLSEQGGPASAVVASYFGAVLCCVAACLSNAVAAVIPFLIVTWDMLTLSPPRLWKVIYGSFPLWVIGSATIAIKKLDADTQLAGIGPGIFSIDRAMLVLNVYWLNLKTLVWPTKLAIHYSKIEPGSLLDAEVVLGGMALSLTGLVLWILRRRKGVLLGLFWFGLGLGPAAQIMPHHISRADRFLYLPLVGLAVAAAMGLRPLGGRLKGHRKGAAVILGVLALFMLVYVSAGQVQTWSDSVSMWKNCLRVDPNNALAYAGLADDFADRGQYYEAICNYQAAVSIDPDAVETLKYYALLLATCPEEQCRDYDTAVRLASRACALKVEPATIMILAEVYAQAGQPEAAIATTEQGIELARSMGDSRLADEFRQRQGTYRNRLTDGRVR